MKLDPGPGIWWKQSKNTESRVQEFQEILLYPSLIP